MIDIPDELTFRILEYAVEEHEYNGDALWCDGPYHDERWTLKSNVAQVCSSSVVHQEQVARSMRNKLAITLTCKHWSALATELLYRTIILRNKNSLAALFEALESNSERGKWTKGIFIYYRDPRLRDLNLDDIHRHFPRLIHHCPNLRTLVLDPQLDLFATFGEAPETSDVIRAIRALSGLKSVSWYIPFSTKASMVDLFSSMAGLVSLRIENSFAFAFLDDMWGPPPPSLNMSALEVLAINGVTKPSLAYIASWSMPKLTWLDVENAAVEPKGDVTILLRSCGAGLRTLNLGSRLCLARNEIVSSALTLCPNLTTFSFNLDVDLQERIVRSPHLNLSRIGIKYPGTLLNYQSDDRYSLRDHRTPGSNLTENLPYLNKNNFPHLSSIRILSTREIHRYMARGGNKDIDYRKSRPWVQLFRRCKEEAIRLEDTTGLEFGVGPLFGGVQGTFSYTMDGYFSAWYVCS